MKGKTNFTQVEIEQLRELIRQRVKAPRDKQKGIRNKMRQIGFYGSDFGIIDMQEADLDFLIETGRISTIREKKQNTISSLLKNKFSPIRKTQTIKNTRLTLHEAMQIVLKEQPYHTMHRKDLANEIMKRKLYEKGDKSAIEPNQISARANNYPHLFKKLENGIISLS